jgi:ABC-type polysaccharide/polyol phosphate export permease
LSAVTVRFRDIMHLYSVFLTALTYLTPVIYPMSILPSWLYKIVMLNPLTNILIMFRNVMINDTIFDLPSLIIAVVETLVFLGIGLYVFYKNQDQFILNI